MKLVLLSKALVNDAYRAKCDALAGFDDLDLTVIVPPSWHEIGGWETRVGSDRGGNYRLLVTPLAFNGHHHVHFYPRLARLLRDLSPDVFHIDEEPFNLATYHAMRIGRSIGARMAFFALATINRRLLPPFSLFQHACFAWSTRALAGARGAEAVLRARGYRKPIDVIPQFGVDVHLFRPREQQLGGTFTIGYVGRLVRAKGVHVLLRAVAKLKGEYRLTIVGDGDFRQDLELLAAAERVADRVEFVGAVAPTAVPEMLRTFHVLAVPSLSTPTWKEQFGRVLVEAMACSVPVVASDSGEIPEVVGEAGVIVPEGDVAALSAALQRLIGDPVERERLAGCGRLRVMTRYTHEAVALRYHDAYRRLAASWRS